MMKANIKYGILGLSMMLSVSCDNILEVDIPDNLVHDEFWQNRDQVHSSLIGLYTSLHSNLNSYHVWGDLRSSFYAPGSGDSFTGSYRQFLAHDIYPTNGLLSWASIYRSITWINSFIKNAPAALERDNTFSPAELQSMMGEAYALRALNYFYLVRAFRDVPIINEPYESDNQQFDTSPSSEDEVLDFIESDLQQALSDAPSTFEAVNYRYGRITKNAVRALWADVKLWRNDYQGCIDLCNQLEAEYAGALVGPLSWYTIFNPGNTTESIFEFQYGQLGPSSPLFNWFSHVERSNEDKYLANATNVNINAAEILYPPLLPGYMSSDTIRLKSFALLSPGSATNGYGAAREVYKFLGTAPYQSSYRPGNARNANYIFYRYREVLFMKAEAYAMLGQYPEAEQQINIIRERCNIPVLGPGEGGEGTEFMARLLMEREYELGFEGKEWFAAVRVARRSGYEGVLWEKSGLNNSLGISYQVVRARLLDPESWFLPYHLTEVENNSQLDQKPFYGNK